jgi:hypothetical protein
VTLSAPVWYHIRSSTKSKPATSKNRASEKSSESQPRSTSRSTGWRKQTENYSFTKRKDRGATPGLIVTRKVRAAAGSVCLCKYHDGQSSRSSQAGKPDGLRSLELFGSPVTLRRLPPSSPFSMFLPSRQNTKIPNSAAPQGLSIDHPIFFYGGNIGASRHLPLFSNVSTNLKPNKPLRQ